MAPRPLAASEAAVHEAAVALRRRIHKDPETAFEEQGTAALVEERMLERGFTV
ncbi:MAG: amidohydrolase, partial [Acidobacteria bacterium]|nr:amidohydrolase [Acidobacteriota bacterium]